MVNSTTKPDNWGMSLLIYLNFGLLGLTIGVGNVIIVCAIARQKALLKSKAYVLIMALAAADATNMTAYCIGGSYWVFKLIVGKADKLVTPWQCMTTVHNMIWVFSQSQSTLMLAAVSIDRFLSAVKPLQYLTLGIQYAWAMIISVLLFTWLVGGFGVLLVYLSEESSLNNTIALCFTPHVFKNSGNKLYGQYWSGAPTVFALTSVILYLFVWITYKRSRFDINRYSECTTQTQQKLLLKKERKISVVLGICCISTLVFYILPYMVSVLTTYLGFTTINTIFGFVSTFNPAANIFIYPMRLREMKKAIKSLFCRNKMPNDLDFWRNTGEPVQQGNSTALRSKNLDLTTEPLLNLKYKGLKSVSCPNCHEINYYKSVV